jgi:hypothetical protein
VFSSTTPPAETKEKTKKKKKRKAAPTSPATARLTRQDTCQQLMQKLYSLKPEPVRKKWQGLLEEEGFETLGCIEDLEELAWDDIIHLPAVLKQRLTKIRRGPRNPPPPTKKKTKKRKK